jgi:hypothetical protein
LFLREGSEGVSEGMRLCICKVGRGSGNEALLTQVGRGSAKECGCVHKVPVYTDMAFWQKGSTMQPQAVLVLLFSATGGGLAIVPTESDRCCGFREPSHLSNWISLLTN